MLLLLFLLLQHEQLLTRAGPGPAAPPRRRASGPAFRFDAFVPAMPVPEHPLLPPWIHVRQASDRLVCYCGDRLVTFRGAACQRFLPELMASLDGRTAAPDMLARADPGVRPGVENALRELARCRLLVDGPPAAPATPGETATLSFFARERMKAPAKVQEEIRGWRIAVFGRAGVAARIARQLEEAGARTLEVDGRIRAGEANLKRDLAVICPDAGQAEDSSAWNRAALAAEAPWYFASDLLGATAFAGPLFLPPDTGCLECFQRRRRSHSMLGEDFDLFSSGLAASPTPGFVGEMVASVSCNAILHWLASRDPFLPGRCQGIEAGRVVRVGQHVLLRVPRCPACSRVAGWPASAPWAVVVEPEGTAAP